MGGVAIALLLADGLTALQTATIASALPFTIALLCSMWGLLKALRLDATKQGLRYQALSISPSAAPTAGGWQRRLRTLMLFPQRACGALHRQVVRPAYGPSPKNAQAGCEVEISEGEDRRLRFEITHEGEPDFIYEVRPRAYAMPSFVVTSEDDEREERKYFRAEVHLKEGGQDYDVMGWSREDVIGDILGQYEAHALPAHGALMAARPGRSAGAPRLECARPAVWRSALMKLSSSASGSDWLTR